MAAPLRGDAAAEFTRAGERFGAQLGAADYVGAERTAAEMRRLAEGPLRYDASAMAAAVLLQGVAIQNQGRLAQAEPLLTWAVDACRRSMGAEDGTVGVGLNSLASLYMNQGRLEKAEPLFREALAIQQRAAGAESADVAAILNSLTILYGYQGRYAEALAAGKRALAIYERVSGRDHVKAGECLSNLAWVYNAQGRYADAEPMYLRGLAIFEKSLGPQHPNVAGGLNNLGMVYHGQGRYADAERVFARALAIREKALPQPHPDVGMSLANMAGIYGIEGRYAEAEPLYRRALAIWRKTLPADSPMVAATLHNFADLYQRQERFAEAEPLFKRALAIRQKILRPEHPDIAATLNGLALLYYDQSRYAEAEPLCRQALAIFTKAFSVEHPHAITCLNNLARLYQDQGRFAESETFYKLAVARGEKVRGRSHPDTAISLCNLASLYRDQGRYAEAESLFKECLAIFEKTQGIEHARVVQTLLDLASVHLGQNRIAEAEPLLDRALAIDEQAGGTPSAQYLARVFRGLLAWKAGRREKAMDDMRRAMALAEQQRIRASGAERERAVLFSRFRNAYEVMLGWQAELGNTDEAFAVLERSRARSLLDELSLAGMDLEAGRSPRERERLRERERDLGRELASLQKQLELLDAGQQSSGEQVASQRRQLQQALARAQSNLYAHHRDCRTSSPVYRGLLARGDGSPPLGEVQRSTLGEGALLLSYLLGDLGGYVLAVDSEGAQVTALAVDDRAAKVLGVDAGPLTAARLHAALIQNKGAGALELLANARQSGLAVEKLATLWEALIPERQREALVAGKLKRLIVVPDGQLALLPFETLVVKADDPPRYLLDVGPPIHYAPSVTVLANLAARPAASPPAGREPVLTVGNPTYAGPEAGRTSPPADALTQLDARGQYHVRGGRFTPLPFSGWESAWVADVFAGQSIPCKQLVEGRATEANVRAECPNRRLLHLACHGLVDQRYGNFYGALALAPGGPEDDPANDGILTLSECYALDLRGAELAVLSACQTNFGPQEQGEGTWALSRGFLVAGARRVVASNWLVDDEAAASLVSYFCSSLAKAEKSGKTIDYAQALQSAKRSIRQQEKWSSPYYWGTFVIVGPD
jgi:CHAT domain-containing protein/Tfp pilus assembly protein PilF